MEGSGKDKRDESEAGRSGAQSWLPADSEPFAEGSDEPAPVNREDGPADEAPTEVQSSDERESGSDGGSEKRGAQHEMPWEQLDAQRERRASSESGSRVSVVDEQPRRPGRPEGASEG